MPTASDLFERVTFSASDSLQLSARDYGRNLAETRDHLPVVCLPGLTRNARDFHQLAEMLVTKAKAPRRVVALDYRGRGHSQWDKDPANYTILKEAEDVVTACTAWRKGCSASVFFGPCSGLVKRATGLARPRLMPNGFR